jgi:hypothetical protein
MVGIIIRVIGGLLISVVGALLVIKTERIIEMAGTSAWAEAKFGTSGGTRFMWKMIGLITVFIGFVIATDMFHAFLMGTIGRLLIPKQPF